jgi:hypothetical protein
MTRLGGASGSLRRLELEQVLGLLGVEDQLAVVELRVERGQRPPHEVGAEVGDQPDAVRQVDAVGERRAALVVDEQERDARWAVHRGHAEHPALEELALAGARGTADERVRALGAQIEVQRAACSLPDECTQRVVALALGCPGVGRERVVRSPRLDDRVGVFGEVEAGEPDERHRSGQVGLVVGPHPAVVDRREASGERVRRRAVDAFGLEVVDRAPAGHESGAVDPRARVGLDEGSACGREALEARRVPHDVDADGGAALGDLDEARPLDRRVVADREHDDRERQVVVVRPFGGALLDDLLDGGHEHVGVGRIGRQVGGFER